MTEIEKKVKMSKCVICKDKKTTGSIELMRDSLRAPMIAGRICYVCLGKIGQTIEECRPGRIHREILADELLRRKT